MTDKSELGCIDSKTFSLGDIAQVNVSVKSVSGKLFLDVRKWYKFSNVGNYIATKKGCMLDLEQWKEIIPAMKAFIDQYETKA